MDSTARAQGVEGRERLAWAILIGSFIIWVALFISVPVLLNRYVQTARRPMVLAVLADEGTVGLSDARGRRPAIRPGEPPQMVEGQATILTNTTDTALVQVFTPDESELLARMVVYGATNLDVIEADAPRFRASGEQYELQLDLHGGRMRVTVPPREGRPLHLLIRTPQGGEVLLEQAGQYNVDVSNLETWVVVQQGIALTSSAGQQLAVGEGQGAVLRENAAPDGPTDTARNLIRNGDFNEGITGWDAAAWFIQRGDQNTGETTISDLGGEKVLRFHRVGEGAARTEIWQAVNQDLADMESLQFLVTLQITAQSLGVCGQVGSECPLFAVMEYEDIYGSRRTWQQGFYAFGTPIPNFTPAFCTSCEPPVNDHVHVPMHELSTWESGNLLTQLAQQNIQPRRLLRVGLKAQGHTFETRVYDVSLVAR